MTTTLRTASIADADSFVRRHVGPGEADIAEMLAQLGYDTLDDLVDATVPEGIRLRQPLAIHAAMGEHEALASLRAIARKNRIFKSFLGYGYHDTLTPPVIQRNILENPGWYTAYTPYQAEIAQGRLEALLNFQTMVIDLTGLEIANASLLDESTAAAEAMFLAYQAKGSSSRNVFFIDARCHPQTIDVVRTRAIARSIDVVVGDAMTATMGENTFGVLVQYPTTDGAVLDYREVSNAAHASGALVVAAADLMSLVLLAPPGEWGADVSAIRRATWLRRTARRVLRNEG
jgi:glycine dehydrogenase